MGERGSKGQMGRKRGETEARKEMEERNERKGGEITGGKTLQGSIYRRCFKSVKLIETEKRMWLPRTRVGYGARRKWGAVQLCKMRKLRPDTPKAQRAHLKIFRLLCVVLHTFTPAQEAEAG